MSDGRLETTYSFYNAEVHIWSAGPSAFFRMVKLACKRKLEAAGAIGPYRLTIRRGDGVMTEHTLIMWEAY